MATETTRHTPSRHLRNIQRKALHEQMVTFIRAFVASVDYHDRHDPDGFVRTMWEARDTARALLRRIEGE